MAMLAAAFTAGGFGALADGRPPPSRQNFMNASAYFSAMPFRIDAVPQSTGRFTGRGSRCQLADGLETVRDQGYEY
jgi:hypothetical protein